MRWASALETGEDTEEAVRQVAERLEAAFGESRVDLIFAFVTRTHRARYAAVPALLRQRFPGAAVIGCSAGGVSASSREVEDAPGLAVVAAHLPDTDIHVFHTEVEGGVLDEAQWRAVVGVDPLTRPVLVLLSDPFSVRTEQALPALDDAFPHSPKVGGLASGGEEPGQVALFAEGFLHRRGLVGVALVGDVEMDTVVAQGARPVGPVFAVTGGRDNLITSLDGEPVLDVLTSVYEGLDQADQALFQRQPMIGLTPDNHPLAGRAGEVLVRSVMGVHRATGVMAVGFGVEVGQSVRFHVRDAASAHEELQDLLREARRPERHAGALLFSCLGRGRAFFGEPDHDARALQAGVGPLPAAGFACNGEIGPVRGRSHVHSYTASIGLFRPGSWD